MVLNENQKEMYKDCVFLNEDLFKSKEEKQKERELYNSCIKEAKNNALKLAQQLASISKQYISSLKINKVKISDLNNNIQSINKAMDNSNLDTNKVYFLQIALARTGNYDDYSDYNNKYLNNLLNLLVKKLNNENFKINYDSDHNEKVTKDFYWFYVDYKKEAGRLMKSKGLKPKYPYNK